MRCPARRSRCRIAEYARARDAGRWATARAPLTSALPRPRSDGPVVVFVRAQGDGRPFQRVYLDPPTGRVLDAAPAARSRRLGAQLPRVADAARVQRPRDRRLRRHRDADLVVERHLPVVAAPAACGAATSASGAASRCLATSTTRSASGASLVLAMLSFTGIFLGVSRCRPRGRSARSAPVSPSPRGIAERRSARDARSAPDEAVAIALQRLPGCDGDRASAFRRVRAASIASACAKPATRHRARAPSSSSIRVAARSCSSSTARRERAATRFCSGSASCTRAARSAARDAS